MKTVKILTLCLAAVFGLYSCGSDNKDEKKEEKNKVYLVKSLTISEDGDYVKYTFTYENNKIVKWTGVDSDGESDGGTFSYPSATSVNYKGFDGEEEVITLDATENVISKQEGMYSDGEQYKGTYSFVDGYLSKISWNENGSIVYAWSNGNLTTIKDTYIYDDGKEEETSTIAYSVIENKTNIDFCLWLDDAEPIYTIQFMKNVSKNIPSSVKYGTGALSIISTTLDEKGRPSKMVYDGCTYTFEYYD